MTDATLTWPAESIALDAASRWVAQAGGGNTGAPTVLQVKGWGVTARFGGVVFKASFEPLFPQLAAVHALLAARAPDSAPRLLAQASVEGQQWTLFERVDGRTAEQIGTADALVAVARRLAAVQAAAEGGQAHGVPAFPVLSVPCCLLADLADQPAELVAWLNAAQSALQDDAQALAELPPSLDHPDVNSSNAIIGADGQAVLLDWEEASFGCPLFSLDRLLADAAEFGAVDRVTAAYLEALPWATQAHVDAALRLVPLKLAAEARAFARALGWAHPHTKLTTALLREAQRRGTARGGASR